MIKAVFDCNIFWQIFFSEKGIGSKCWDLVKSNRVELFVSKAVLDEIRDVLTRPETKAKFKKATDEIVGYFIDEIADNSIFVNPVIRKFEYSRDPKDEPYINLAIAADAKYIVSRDRDLLDLMTHFDDDSRQFRQRFRSLSVVDAVTFVGIVEKVN